MDNIFHFQAIRICQWEAISALSQQIQVTEITAGHYGKSVVSDKKKNRKHNDIFYWFKAVVKTGALIHY